MEKKEKQKEKRKPRRRTAAKEGEMSFSELRSKEVINICDGRRMGHPIDLVLSENACAEAIVVPGAYSIRNVIKGMREGIVIPWNRIRRIGDDVILVELDACFFQ